jgi:hypothetical protein
MLKTQESSYPRRNYRYLLSCREIVFFQRSVPEHVLHGLIVALVHCSRMSCDMHCSTVQTPFNVLSQRPHDLTYIMAPDQQLLAIIMDFNIEEQSYACLLRYT